MAAMGRSGRGRHRRILLNSLLTRGPGQIIGPPHKQAQFYRNPMHGAFRIQPLPMQQLILDIRPDTPKRFDNFVVGANAEVVARLQAATQAGRRDLLYLYGRAGQRPQPLARSHPAARGTADTAPAGQRRPAISRPNAGTLLLIDDIEQLDEARADRPVPLLQRGAARRPRAGAGGQRSAAAPAAARGSAHARRQRADVRDQAAVRRRQGAHPARAGAGARHAVDAELVDYLLRHGRRDLPSLLAVLDALDAASLERKRPITLPLLRELMQAPCIADLTADSPKTPWNSCSSISTTPCSPATPTSSGRSS